MALIAIRVISDLLIPDRRNNPSKHMLLILSGYPCVMGPDSLQKLGSDHFATGAQTYRLS